VRRIYPVLERVQETPSTVTLRFEDATPARPGQFVMVWLPGDDELPMSLSYVQTRKGVTIKKMGDTSGRMCQLRVGDRIGIRGPYGNTFSLEATRILVVGGGSGTAVLAPAAEAAAANGSKIVAALGGTTASEVLFADRFLKMNADVEIATDDGTGGHRGFVTDVAERMLRAGGFDAVWTCGPEVMMRKVMAAAAESGAPVFCAMERHMKCALGLCDACAFGPLHVCQDGPVFPAEVLRGIPEFGVYQRDASGRRVAQRGAVSTSVSAPLRTRL
jgi:dihydroorotate dehydrogenase electron transfer subunit